MEVYPGWGLGFLALGASLHDVLTHLKAQPQTYTTINISYSHPNPLVEPVILNLPANGFRLRFDGPDQRLRLIEILDFSKTKLSYESKDIVKLPDTTGNPLLEQRAIGPYYRHLYQVIGPSYAGEYIKPSSDAKDPNMGTYIHSYPGMAFAFHLLDSSWSKKNGYIDLLTSELAAPARSMAIFSGSSWPDECKNLFDKPCPNPRSLALSARGKELRPDEIDLVKVRGNGKLELIRRSSSPFQVTLNKTTPQDLVAELGPPDAIYRKYDRRLSIHKAQNTNRKTSQGHFGNSPPGHEDLIDTDQSSTYCATDESDVEGHKPATTIPKGESSAESFYNYFNHGFDFFVSYPSSSSPCLPPFQAEDDKQGRTDSPNQLVVTKILLHGNVPGSYPFNRYRRCRWLIDIEDHNLPDGILGSETSFTHLSGSLKRIWNHNLAEGDSKDSFSNGMVLNRGWDSPGSSCELLGGWEESTHGAQKKNGNFRANGNLGLANTELFGFPGLIFEVLKNDTVNCLTIY